jgi:hypothetical protein
MTIEITGSRGTPGSEPLDALRQNGVQTRDQASDTTVLITEAEVALGTAAATAARQQERRWVALLSRIFAVPTKSRSKRGPYLPPMAYLEPARLAREMERL